MSRRFYTRCLLWLLPLLVAQALVPVGFMIAGNERGLQIEFCPVQSAQVVDALAQLDHAVADHSSHQQAHAAHHANDTNDSDDASHNARANSCPYALAATAIGSAPAASIAAVTLIQVDVLRSPEHSSPFDFNRVAANRVRGPPHLFS